MVAGRTNGQEVFKGQNYTNVASTTANAVKTGPGRLCRIINTAGTGTITAHDALTATSTKLFEKTVTVVGDIYEVDIPFGTGLTIVSAANTVNVVWS